MIQKSTHLKSHLDYLTDDLSARIKNAGDRTMDVSLACYYLFGIAIAFEYNTFAIAFGVGTLLLLAYYGCKLLLPRHSLYQYVGSAVVAVFTAQFIYQMHGLAEMHFFVFIGATLMITYQKWQLQLPNIIIVVLHHATFAYLQYKGNKEIYFTPQDYMELRTFVLHGALAAVVVWICGYWAYKMERRTQKENLMKTNMLTQLKSVQQNIAFAESISEGNLDSTAVGNDTNDELSQSLVKMQQSLIAAQKKDAQDKFITVGIAQIGEILRSGADIHTLSYEIISNLVKYMKANQGGIFILEDKDNDPHLELTACYAYERRKYLKKRIEIGEGLIGQAVQEGDTIFLTDLPQDYIHITSGLGKANPSCVLIVPLKFNDHIEGVIELASFSTLETHEVKFLEVLAEMIASTVSTTRTNEVTKKLLAELKQQTEMLRSQEEEMRQNMEELAATQEEMERRQAEMEELRQAEIRQFQQRIRELEAQAQP
jgi:methyl-accepting chemotaxis protein